MTVENDYRDSLQVIQRIGADNLLDTSIQPRAVPHGRADSMKARIDEADTPRLRLLEWPRDVVRLLVKLHKICSGPEEVKSITLRFVHIRQNHTNLRQSLSAIREVQLMDLEAAMKATKEAKAANTPSEQNAAEHVASPLGQTVHNAMPFQKPKTHARHQSLFNSRWTPKNETTQALAVPSCGRISSGPKPTAPLGQPTALLLPDKSAHSNNSDQPLQVQAPTVSSGVVSPGPEESNLPEQISQFLPALKGDVAPVPLQSTSSEQPSQPFSTLNAAAPAFNQAIPLERPLQSLTVPSNDVSAVSLQSTPSDQSSQPLSTLNAAAPVFQQFIPLERPSQSLTVHSGDVSPVPLQFASSGQSPPHLPAPDAAVAPVLQQSMPLEQPIRSLPGLFEHLSLENDNPSSSPKVELPPAPFPTMKGINIQFGNLPSSSMASSNDAPAVDEKDFKLLQILKSYVTRLELIELHIGPANVNESQDSATGSYLTSLVRLNDNTAKLDVSSTDALHGNYQELIDFNAVWLVHWRLVVKNSLRKLYEHFQEHSSLHLDSDLQEHIVALLT
ncbi:hypothetical protein HDK64DRAFT_306311 [Phyllosticta capitalensis]